MGNHAAGRAMVGIAMALIAVRPKTGQSALEILDHACKDYRGCDAEFDDEAYSDRPFGKLITEAFAPDFDPSTDEDGEGWYEAAYEPFRERYGLC